MEWRSTRYWWKGDLVEYSLRKPSCLHQGSDAQEPLVARGLGHKTLTCAGAIRYREGKEVSSFPFLSCRWAKLVDTRPALNS